MEIESISPAAGRLPASGCFPAGRLPAASPAESRRNHPPENAPRRKTKNSSHLDSDSREANSRLLQSKAKEVSFSHLDGTKYHAMGAIGSGAYGVVCAALDKKTKEKVAIKKIPNAMEMSVIAKRTYREIKILRHFKHENIIGIKDILLSKEERTSKDADGAETKTTLANSLKDIYVVLDFMESDLHHIIHSKQASWDRESCEMHILGLDLIWQCRFLQAQTRMAYQISMMPIPSPAHQSSPTHLIFSSSFHQF